MYVVIEVACINCAEADLESGNKSCLVKFMSVVSEAIGTKGVLTALQCSMCIVRGWGPL